MGVPADFVIFPGQTLENWDCPGKTGKDGHLTGRPLDTTTSPDRFKKKMKTQTAVKPRNKCHYSMNFSVVARCL